MPLALYLEDFDAVSRADLAARLADGVEQLVEEALAGERPVHEAGGAHGLAE